MKTLVLTIIIVFYSTLINAKEYFFCEENLFGEGRSNTKNFILDYKSHEKDEIILAYKFSDYDVSILRFIQEEQVLFESFRESILNNTFDINDSDNDKPAQPSPVTVMLTLVPFAVQPSPITVMLTLGSFTA